MLGGDKICRPTINQWGIFVQIILTEQPSTTGAKRTLPDLVESKYSGSYKRLIHTVLYWGHVKGKNGRISHCNQLNITLVGSGERGKAMLQARHSLAVFSSGKYKTKRAKSRKFFDLPTDEELHPFANSSVTGLSKTTASTTLFNGLRQS